MKEVVDLLERLANVESPVLLEGESGTGKDLAAHLIHYAGVRRHGPLIKIHCPAIPDELLESELLGHERGAFTDASSVKLGKLELADGGTLFFDQIDDLAPMLQAKLLRFVEEKSFERVGGTKTRSLDVRFVASASASLRNAVSSGRFREDLYHRLNVVPVTLPPLRERREDIAPLAELFLERAREAAASLARRASRTTPFRPSTAICGPATYASCGRRWSGRRCTRRPSIGFRFEGPSRCGLRESRDAVDGKGATAEPAGRRDGLHPPRPRAGPRQPDEGRTDSWDQP